MRLYSLIPFGISSNLITSFKRSQISLLNLIIAPKTCCRPAVLQLSTTAPSSSLLSVINGIIGSTFTPQHTPAVVNFFIASNILSAGGVPGSTLRLIRSLHVVIDQTTKQLCRYLLCNSRSLSIIVDLVKT